MKLLVRPSLLRGEIAVTGSKSHTIRGIAAALGVPFYATSHQQGHVRAAMVDSGIRPGAFVAMHLSGGTTETLYADENRALSKVGGSNDLHAGQLVDRVGVRLGLGFPAGPALERLAVRGTATGALLCSSEAAVSAPMQDHSAAS